MPFLDTGRPEPDGGSSDRERERILWILQSARAQAQARARSAEAAQAARDDDPRSLSDAAERVVSQIERLEVQKAQLEGRLIDAYAALHTIEEQHLERTAPRSPVPLSADQVTAHEISWATGVGAAEVSRRLELATGLRRHRVLRERLRSGGVSLYRALRIVAETRNLDDDVIPDLESTVLAPAPDGSVASQRLFASRLQRCVRSADGRSQEERRQAASRRRSVHGRIVEDGMGTFTVVAPAEQVVGVLDRVDALARSARAAGDERSLDQLRSDFLCQLALFGVLPGAACDAGSSGAGAAFFTACGDEAGRCHCSGSGTSGTGPSDGCASGAGAGASGPFSPGPFDGGPSGAGAGVSGSCSPGLFASDLYGGGATGASSEARGPSTPGPFDDSASSAGVGASGLSSPGPFDGGASGAGAGASDSFSSARPMADAARSGRSGGGRGDPPARAATAGGPHGEAATSRGLVSHPDARRLSGAPPAVVRIVVPFEVAVGLSDAACELPGHGWVTAAHARAIMTAPGSVWQRLAVDVDSGRALELSTDRYTPTREMVEHVRAVDGVCRAPGCQVPADRCDWDHLVPWPLGPTRASNGDSLSRGCHNGKTAGIWKVQPVADQGISWTTPAGRDYITYPKDWREALVDPGSDAPTTQSSAPELDDEPPPF